MKKVLTFSLSFVFMLSALLVSAFYIGASNMTVVAASSTQERVLKANMIKLNDPDIMSGVIISRTGTVQTMSNIWTSGYIAVKPNTWYTYNSKSVFMPCFDSNKQFIGFVDYGGPNEEQRTDISQNSNVDESGNSEIFIHPNSEVAFVRAYFDESNSNPLFVIGKGLDDEVCKVEIAFMQEGNPDLFYETLGLIQDGKHFNIDTRHFAEGRFSFNTKTLVYSLTDDTQMVFAVDVPLSFLKETGYFDSIDNLVDDNWHSEQFNVVFNTPNGAKNWLTSNSNSNAKFRYRQEGTSTIAETPETPEPNNNGDNIPIWQIALGVTGGLLVLIFIGGAINTLINPKRKK